jgi:two-component system sensor histidine kinase GlrK
LSRGLRFSFNNGHNSEFRNSGTSSTQFDMPFPRPRSLTSLLLLGILLVVVPLAGAVLQAGTQLGRLSKETDRLVREGVGLSGETQSLFRYLTAYERSANLYLLLADPRLLEASRATQAQLLGSTERLAGFTLDDATRGHLDDLRRATQAVLAVLEFGPPGDPGRPARLAARLDELSAAADAVSTSARASLELRLAALEQRTARTRDRLTLWLAALVPAAIVLGLFFTLGVLRPLRRIDQAITELGRGAFSRPIAIQGPSDIETLGRQLEWLRVRLVELAQEKNRFLRHMSHELKTPLANIREGTDLLLDGAVGDLDSQQREVTGILRDSGLKLQQLIENLLSYSAWQSQATVLDLSRFTLASVIKAAFDAQRLAIAARQIEVRQEVDDTEVRADRAKLRLIFDNLLSNALKFTPAGGTISVRVRRTGQNVVVDFADTGPGIPAGERERIFEAFYTGSTPQAGPLKGSGIGLSVVVEFVAAHGGRVELASGEFPGAHFRIRLPLDAGILRRERQEADA